MFWFRIFIFIFAFSFAGCEESNQRPENSKSVHVGMIAGLDHFDPVLSSFITNMQMFGFINGDNIRYSIRRAKGDKAEMLRIAEDFVERDVDLILTTTTHAALAAKKATKGTDLPVIFTIVMTPVLTGVVDNLTSPSANVSGVRMPTKEFIGKRLEILLQVAPGVKSILVPYDPNYPTSQHAMDAVRQAAKILNLTVAEILVSSPQDVADYFVDQIDPDFGAILIMPDITVQNDIALQATFAFANQHNIPVIANSPKQVESGALFSYLSDNAEVGRAAAQLANKALDDKALDGKAMRMHPVINAEPQLVLNMRVAKKLNLIVDESLLTLAQYIIDE